jgi:capsular polysaccharide biosynthesis protein
MVYRSIRLTLGRFERFFTDLHNFWLEVPKKISSGTSFKLITLEQADSKLIHSTEGGIESQFFPKIVNHTNGGEIYVNVPPIEVRLVRDVSFVFGSNFLRFSNKKVIHQKICRHESMFSDPGDQDLLSIRDNKYRLKKYEKKMHLEIVFHVTGSFSAHWGHFLAEYFPRMEYLKALGGRDEKIDIVVFEQTDPHIIAVIKEVVSEFSFVRVNVVPKDVEICCSSLYYVSNDTFISDMGSIQSPLNVLISDSSAKYLYEFGKKATQTLKVNNKLKRVFIGRSGKRNLVNYKECLDFFTELGFTEVFPHRLSYRDKLELFANVEYVVGPGSSGFTNIIYCQKLKGVIQFFNKTRHTDMYLTKLAHLMSVPVYTLIGNEVVSSDMDSDYTINISDIVSCLKNFPELKKT